MTSHCTRARFSVLASCRVMSWLQFTHARSFARRGRLRNLGADSSTIGLYCITITWQQIFKGSLQVAAVGVLPLVTIERIGISAGNAARQGCQIAFFDAKFNECGIFRGSWLKKIVWLFGFFSSIFGFFGGSWHILLKIAIRRFCLVYFLKSYLATHRIIKLYHIWQPIMLKVRVETLWKMWTMKTVQTGPASKPMQLHWASRLWGSRASGPPGHGV